MGGSPGGWTFGFLGPIIGLLIMAAIVFALWSAISTGRSVESRTEQSDDALESLRKRYARGDIDEETYESRADKLRER